MNMIDPGSRRFLFWRLPILGATLLVVWLQAPGARWAMMLSLPVVTGMLAVYLFEPAVLERWISRGYLILSDTLLVCLALLGTGGAPASWFVGLFSVVLIAVLLGDRVKSLLAGGVLLALMAALSSSGWFPGWALTRETTLLVPFLVCAALSFGALGERMSGHAEAAVRARKQTSELWALLEISETIGSTLDVGQVMRAIVRYVGDMVHTDSCSILVVNEPLRSCSVVASKGHPDVEMLELELDKYPEIQRALETREPVVIKDVETDPLVASVRDVLLEKGYRSLVVVPLVFGREVLGTLFLRARREEPFSADELRFCKVAAGASANALKNAVLFREVAREAEQHRVTGEKLRRVLDGTPDLIVATDVEGRITEFNRGAESLTGWIVERARGRAFTDIFGSQVSRIATDADHEPSTPTETTLIKPDGDKVQISLVSAPMCGADGQGDGRVWIGRDVTKLRQVERSLVQAERLSSLGEVVAGVAHELNNPLSGVMGYAELLRAQASEPNQLRDLERIVESSARCQKIVLKLLSFARRHPLEKKYQSLNDCLTKVLDLKSYHLRSSQIETVLELDPGLPNTSFDFHQIEQVVLNLLNNAEQSVASLRRAGRIVLRSGVRAGSLFLEVEDNGAGVPAAIRDKIFDPFFTTKGIGQGTGLGLSVSYGIVQEHDGRIEVREATGEGGACFTVYLPQVEGPELQEQPATASRVADANPLRDLRILVAEDEPVVLDLFNRVLQQDGADVTLAHDGAEAWQFLQEHEFDLIVVDLRMPNLSGQQLYERVAAERPDLLRRFVFATGDLMRQESASFLHGLPNRILTKPLEVETVRRVLAQAVASQDNVVTCRAASVSNM
jgi:two-component system NtrC family sensor kinase